MAAFGVYPGIRRELMMRFCLSTGLEGISVSPPFGSVALESLLTTDSVMRVRGASSPRAAARSAPLSCAELCQYCSLGMKGVGVWLTRRLLREGVAMESGVSPSDCCFGSASLRLRRPTLRLDEGGIVHGELRLQRREEGREQVVGRMRRSAQRRAEREWMIARASLMPPPRVSR